MKKIIIIVLLIFILYVIDSNIGFKTNHYSLAFPSLESSKDSFRIAHISDLHNRNIGKKLSDKIKEENPDIIAITGDLIDSNRTDIGKAMDFIDRINGSYPIYYVPGNHEGRSSLYPELKEDLLERKVIILEDRCDIIDTPLGRINICGFVDPEFYRFSNSNKTNPAFRLNKIRTSQKIKILLAHRPDLFNFYEEKGFDLILSGHAHGGQFRLPIIGGLFAPNQGFFPEYSKGIYKLFNSKMIVSRGLGNSVFPIRFANKPELIIINIFNENKE